jgi:hypothetical protein
MLLCPRCHIAHSSLCTSSSVFKLNWQRSRLTHTCHAKQWPTPPSPSVCDQNCCVTTNCASQTSRYCSHSIVATSCRTCVLLEKSRVAVLTPCFRLLVTLKDASAECEHCLHCLKSLIPGSVPVTILILSRILLFPSQKIDQHTSAILEVPFCWFFHCSQLLPSACW